MTPQTPGGTLTNRQKDQCLFLGLAGIAFTIICLIKVLRSLPAGHWLVYSLFFSMLLVFVSFLLLLNQKELSVIFLIISGAAMLIIVLLFARKRVYLPPIFLLLAYQVITIITLYVCSVPHALRIKAAALKQERKEWTGKI